MLPQRCWVSQPGSFVCSWQVTLVTFPGLSGCPAALGEVWCQSVVEKRDKNEALGETPTVILLVPVEVVSKPGTSVFLGCAFLLGHHGLGTALPSVGHVPAEPRCPWPLHGPSWTLTRCRLTLRAAAMLLIPGQRRLSAVSAGSPQQQPEPRCLTTRWSGIGSVFSPRDGKRSPFSR